MLGHKVTSTFHSLKSTAGYPGLLAILALLILLHVWLVLAIVHQFRTAIFLLSVVSIFWTCVAYFLFGHLFPKNALKRLLHISNLPYFNAVLVVFALTTITAFVLSQSYNSRPRMQSFGSLILIIVISVLLSDSPGRIRWRPVITGIILQYAFALLILKFNAGKTAFSFIIDQIVYFLNYTNVGTSFVFGFIPNPPNFCGMEGPYTFTSLPILIFFAAICHAGYYLGVVQWLTKYFGSRRRSNYRNVAGALQFVMGTTSAETLNAIGSIFIGPTDSSLLMQFALPTMTFSEIVATMSTGFSMIDGSLFTVYISFGACSTLLLSANVMSAPAAFVPSHLRPSFRLAIAKIITPERQESRQKDIKAFVFPASDSHSLLDAICKGATSSMIVVFAITANLLVFLAMLAFVDKTIGFVCSAVGYDGVTFDQVLSWCFFPVAYLMGVSDAPTWEAQKAEILNVAQLIGSKTALNEFIAFQQMKAMLVDKKIGPRAQLMAIYCLCGYSNPANIGSALGIFGSMCAERKKDIVRASGRCLLIGILSCFMTACIAGSIVTSDMGCAPTTNPFCFDVSNATSPGWTSS